MKTTNHTFETIVKSATSESKVHGNSNIFPCFYFFLFFFLAFSGYRVVGLNRQAMAIKPSSLKIDVNWILRVPGPCYWGCSLNFDGHLFQNHKKKNHKNRKKGFDLMDRIETNVIYFFLHILYCIEFLSQSKIQPISPAWTINQKNGQNPGIC